MGKTQNVLLFYPMKIRISKAEHQRNTSKSLKTYLLKCTKTKYEHFVLCKKSAKKLLKYIALSAIIMHG